MPCVLKIMCAKDKDMVQQASSTQKLYKADNIFFDDAVFDGKQWTTDRFIAGGTAGGGEIMMRSGDSCERAATVLYHETWHTKQPPGMGWPHPSEDDAYYQTELWTIANNLPSQGGSIRTVDAKGNVVPDKAAIKKLVDREYPVQPPAPAGWRRRDFKKVPPQTKWVNTATRATAWKPSVTGETFPGRQQTVNKKAVDMKTLKCP